MKRLIATSPIDIITTNSGRTLMPGVSSSKNRSKPALAAGIGASRLRLFSRADDKPLTMSVGLWLQQLSFGFDASCRVSEF
jgi:hypothetical protein